MKIKVSSVQAENLLQHIDMLRKALVINIVVILVRLASYAYWLGYDAVQQNDFSFSYHLWMISWVPYTVYLVYQLSVRLPKNCNFTMESQDLNEMDIRWLQSK